MFILYIFVYTPMVHYSIFLYPVNSLSLSRLVSMNNNSSPCVVRKHDKTGSV